MGLSCELIGSLDGAGHRHELTKGTSRMLGFENEPIREGEGEKGREGGRGREGGEESAGVFLNPKDRFFHASLV